MRNLTAHITKNGLCESYNLFIFELGEIAEKPLCKGNKMDRNYVVQQKAEFEQKSNVSFLPISDFEQFCALFPENVPIGQIKVRFAQVKTIKEQYAQLVQNSLSIYGQIEAEWINQGQ